MRILAITLVCAACGGSGGSPGVDGGGDGGTVDAAPPPLFGEHVDVPIAGAWRIAAANLDGDAASDLVVLRSASVGADTIAVVPGSATRTFAPVTYVGTPSADTLALADVDGDGAIDIVGGARFGDFLGVMRGVGDGTFGASIDSTIGASSGDLALGRFDADATLDVVVPGGAGAGSEASFVPGTGDGHFGAAQPITLDARVDDAVAADLDGDASLDVAMTSFNDDTVVAFTGNGDGTFVESWRTIVPNVMDLAAADFDGDGVSDLALLEAGRIAIARGAGDGTFTVGGEASAHTATLDLLAADLDGDGDVDVAATDGLADEQVQVLRNDGAGNLSAPESYDLPTESVADLAAGDFDGDGHADLAIAIDATGGAAEVRILFGG